MESLIRLAGVEGLVSRSSRATLLAELLGCLGERQTLDGLGFTSVCVAAKISHDSRCSSPVIVTSPLTSDVASLSRFLFRSKYLKLNFLSK